MILHRFCSEAEYAAFMRGETLENHTDHYRGGKGGSTSRGFCFFKGSARSWARRLNGLVDFDVLITVEVSRTKVRESLGVYADWARDPGYGIPPRAVFKEFCAESYRIDDFKLLDADRSYSTTHISRSKYLKP